ncbi:hypothetical protein GLU64_02215 [Nanohaloarchaea archaeon]|nr:hypothetical protein [Candidatus Nanohaloarchaea archaeon]
MSVANSLAGLIDRVSSDGRVGEKIDEKRNRNTLQEFKQDTARIAKSEQDVASIAKFDPEDEIPSIEKLYDQVTDENGNLEHNALQIGGTNEVEPGMFMNWVEAAYKLSNMSEERGNQGLSVLAEPSEKSHVLNQESYEEVVLEPDYFTVPRITNTEDDKYRGELHEEFIDKMNDYIASNDSKEALSEHVSEQVKSDIRERVPDNTVAQSAGDRILSASSGIVDALAEKKVENYLRGTDGTRRSKDADSVLKEIFWSQWITEDYFVTNPEASVATKTGADDWLQGKGTIDLMQDVQEKIKQSAEAGEPRYRAQSVFYIEGSGAQAPFEIIKAADLAKQEYNLDIQILYGGGIENGDNQPDLIRHDDYELEYSLSDDKLLDAGFDPDQFEAIDYDPDDLTGKEQKDLVDDAGADAYIQGNSVQI